MNICQLRFVIFSAYLIVVDNHFHFVYPEDQCKMLENFSEI